MIGQLVTDLHRSADIMRTRVTAINPVARCG